MAIELFAFEFLREIESVFGPLDFVPVADGEFHRFYVPGDKSGTTNGWYRLTGGELPRGEFNSWKRDSEPPYRWWSGFGSSMSKKEKRAYELKRLRDEQARAEAKRTIQKAAAIDASARWRNSKPVDPNHPYLQSKGLSPKGIRQKGVNLLVPIQNIEGQLVNLQMVSLSRKFFVKGGQVSGCFHLIGEIDPHGELAIAEGWATGMTFHKLYRVPVACAMNCKNLLSVAKGLHKKYPDIRITIVGDDDWKTERRTGSNPGKESALAAALAVGGDYILPTLCKAPTCHCSDFNDAEIEGCLTPTSRYRTSEEGWGVEP